MRTCFRIVQAHLARSAFDGEGARLHGGRWNSPGRSMIYCAESRALAGLEMLVRLEAEDLLERRYCVIPARFPDELIQRLEERSDLPADWSRYPVPASTRHIGDQWLTQGRTAVLSVPSCVVPSERNFLLNPRHSDFKRIKIQPPEPFAFDPRLAR